MTRERLSNRRPAETFDLEVGGLRYTCTVGRFGGGELAEIFLSNGKAGSDSDTAARDSAVVASIALQYGVPAAYAQPRRLGLRPARRRTRPHPGSGARAMTAVLLQFPVRPPCVP